MGKRSFRDQVVVITGASSGIGRELALQLADQGAWLALAARDAGRLEQVADHCRGRAARALAVVTDVTQQAQCQALVERTVAEYGRIDVLINNAGLYMWARFDEIEDVGMLEKIMRVNYLGSVYCTHYALPLLKRSRGLLVGISSLAAKTGVPTASGYAASKHAMTGFFESLRIELAADGVDVTMVYPGFVATEVRQRACGPDGRPMDVSPLDEDTMMSADTCARLILAAAARRRRELVMTLRGKLGQWIKLVAPGLVDRVAAQAMSEDRPAKPAVHSSR